MGLSLLCISTYVPSGGEDLPLGTRILTISGNAQLLYFARDITASHIRFIFHGFLAGVKQFVNELNRNSNIHTACRVTLGK